MSVALLSFFLAILLFSFSGLPCRSFVAFSCKFRLTDLTGVLPISIISRASLLNLLNIICGCKNSVKHLSPSSQPQFWQNSCFRVIHPVGWPQSLESSPNSEVSSLLLVPLKASLFLETDLESFIWN